MHRIQVGQSQLEHPLVVMSEFVLSALIIERVAGALLKHKHHNPRQHNFDQRIVGLRPAVFQLAYLVKQ